MRILFVHQGLQSFVQKDLDILRSTHEVRSIEFSVRGRVATRLIPGIWKLWLGVIWCDLTFSWFGKLHAFFAVLFSRILGKKSVVVAGGDDVGMIIHSGKPDSWPAHPLLKYFAYYIFRTANRIITVSKFNHLDTLCYVKADPKKMIIIYHGFDGNQFRKPYDLNKEDIVVTVGGIGFESYDRKGFKLFVESAQYFPQVLFLVVGPSKGNAQDKLKKIAPSNVVFTGPLYGQDLIRILSRGKVYVQASEWESFGCAIAEGMLCECIPVVANRTAMPEVVGEAGYYINDLTPEELSKAIEKALSDQEMGIKARERIIRNFSLEKRRRKLLSVLEELTSSISKATK